MKRTHLLAGVLGVIVVALAATFLSQSDSGTFKGAFAALRPLAYSLNTANVEFLHTLNGSQSRREITVTNNTNHQIQFNWSRLPNSPMIRLENASNFTVPANASRQIGFIFAPTENVNNVYRATAQLFGEGIGREITLVGNAQKAFNVSPTNVSFLRTVVGSTSTRDVTIENYTGDPLEFYIDNPRSAMYQFLGSHTGNNFSRSHTLTVPARSNRSVRFSFTPRVARAFGEEVENRIIYATGLQDGVDLVFSAVGVAR